MTTTTMMMSLIANVDDDDGGDSDDDECAVCVCVFVRASVFACVRVRVCLRVCVCVSSRLCSSLGPSGLLALDSVERSRAFSRLSSVGGAMVSGLVRRHR